MAVTGVGGVFFRATDPKALKQWYRLHLGVVMEGYEPWRQAAGPTMITPFAADTDYWSSDKSWMINFRVTNLDELIAKLRRADIAVRTDPAWDAPRPAASPASTTRKATPSSSGSRRPTKARRRIGRSESQQTDAGRVHLRVRLYAS